MKPDFSEFTYGFAITEELINWSGALVTAVPIFPSLKREGESKGGYDVLIDRNGLPMFLQFKCSRQMKNKNALGFKKRIFNDPYFQIDLRATRHSNQHPMLLDLEREGKEVYYVAPMFCLLDDLNKAYLRTKVRERSKFIRPSTIGVLPDKKAHSWAFDDKGNACLFSEPRVTESPLNSDQFGRHIVFQFKERSSTDLSREAISSLENTLIEIIQERIPQTSIQQIDGFGLLRERLSPLERISYLARAFLDCAFYVLTDR